MKTFMLCKLSGKNKLEWMEDIREDMLLERQKLITLAIAAIKEVRLMDSRTVKQKEIQQQRWIELQKPFDGYGNIYAFEEQKDWLVIPKITIRDYEKEKEKETI